jgi:hypothetical protein
MLALAFLTIAAATGHASPPPEDQIPLTRNEIAALPSPSISASTPYSAERSSSTVSTACALCRRSAQARSYRFA